MQTYCLYFMLILTSLSCADQSKQEKTNNAGNRQESSQSKLNVHNLEGINATPFCRKLLINDEATKVIFGCKIIFLNKSEPLISETPVWTVNYKGSVPQQTTIEPYKNSEWSQLFAISSPLPDDLETAIQSLVLSIKLGSDLADNISMNYLLKNDPLRKMDPPSYYRLNFLEVSEPCVDQSVVLQGLQLSWDETTQVDSFANIPQTNDPQANVGTIGGEIVTLSSSGSFSNYLEFEAFGGGFGNGWWSSEGSFIDSKPVNPVWFQIQFIELGRWIDKIFFVAQSEVCSPRKFNVEMSLDGITWETLRIVDQQNGDEFTVNLSYTFY